MVKGMKIMGAIGPGTWKTHGGRRNECKNHRWEWSVKNRGVGIVQKGIEEKNSKYTGG